MWHSSINKFLWCSIGMGCQLLHLLLNEVFRAKYQGYNVFVIIIPGFSESESDIGNDILSISSDTLSISNRKNQYTRYIKNMWQLASISLIIHAIVCIRLHFCILFHGYFLGIGSLAQLQLVHEACPKWYCVKSGVIVLAKRIRLALNRCWNVWCFITNDQN